ncbi:phosphotransferase enzyme family protein [Paraburkholderia phenazinium]|uniref:Ser/Thr protein kinase RdoA involved in Cpx stress response, MazF antagonist n=1 Tax=Paraburkholderia phenazinium TaxID=60549 RepID=A0A1N6FVG6_9BURK|nr:phosphotransferase [Paraburkholderia phenazinium]SIN99243.1 Ser/Thr protein kinase RdoA involved in Cpx stress response, MazF antagonist [Paraburkholderia phenazinium]
MLTTQTDGSNPIRAVYSTIGGDEIREVLEQNFEIGPVVDCTLLQAGFNDIYEVVLADGQRCVARLSSRLERGVPNVDYETALLQHLKRAGATVAAPWVAKGGALSVEVLAPEGPRSLAVFDFLSGKPLGDEPADITAMGAELARIHILSRDYKGPPSNYQLDFDHLLRRPLTRLLAIRDLHEEVREMLSSIALSLEGSIATLNDLSRVACHGDCHGWNTHMTDGPDGARVASFFDFDDGGPGYLAYDLAVCLWNNLLGRQLERPDEEVETKWGYFVNGYRSVEPVPSVDFEAVMTFVAIRHFWLMGEYASRVHRMGLGVFRGPWFRKDFELVKQWQSLTTPGA